MVDDAYRISLKKRPHKERAFRFNLQHLLRPLAELDLNEKLALHPLWVYNNCTAYRIREEGRVVTRKVLKSYVDEAFSLIYYHMFFAHHRLAARVIGIHVDDEYRRILHEYESGELDDATIELFKSIEKDNLLSIEYAITTEAFDGSLVDYCTDETISLDTIMDNTQAYFRKLLDFMKLNGILCLELFPEHLMVNWKNQSSQPHSIALGHFELCCNTRNTRNSANQFVKCESGTKMYAEYNIIHCAIFSMMCYTYCHLRSDFDAKRHIFFKSELSQVKSALKKGKWKRAFIKNSIDKASQEPRFYATNLLLEKNGKDALHAMFEVARLE